MMPEIEHRAFFEITEEIYQNTFMHLKVIEAPFGTGIKGILILNIIIFMCHKYKLFVTVIRLHVLQFRSFSETRLGCICLFVILLSFILKTIRISIRMKPIHLQSH